MARRRRIRNLIPLTLVGVLSVAAAGVAVAAGIHHHPTSSPEGSPAPPAPAVPAVFRQALASTVAAKTAQFTLTSSTTGVTGGLGSTSRGFGSVNFGADTADVYVTSSAPGSAHASNSTSYSSVVTVSSDQVATATGVYEKAAGSPTSAALWLRIPGVTPPGPAGVLAETQAGAALLSLERLGGTTTKVPGVATVSGVTTTAYKETSPVVDCSTVGHASVLTETGLTVWLDAQHRIRQVSQVTFERYPQAGDGHGRVVSVADTLTFTQFGIPVTITVPTKAVHDAITSSLGSSSSPQCTGKFGWVAYAPLGG